MKKIITVIIIAAALCLGGYFSVSIAHDDGTPHFHCSVCGSHDHGSMWHDSDKDGVPDR